MQIEFPGLFDLQVNGFGGVDFNSPATASEDVFKVVERLQITGVTRFLPTLITSSLDRFAKCARTVTGIPHPAIAGLHLEGPYIAAEDGPRGAHPREYVTAASVGDFCRRQEAAQGRIRLVTLAPEVPGAIDLIEYLVAQGVRVAIGHTAATPQQIRDAISAGARLSTHLGNGCAQQLPRHPNLLWEQLAADELSASLIVDGHHLPASTVKTTIRAKSPARTFLITDAVAAAGCAPGRYELNGESVVLDEDGRVSPPGKPWLAGSSLTLERAVANVVRITGLPLEAAWAMASTQPAQFLGLETAGTVVGEWDGIHHRFTNLRVLDE